MPILCQDPLEKMPTGVLIDAKCSVKIVFSLAQHQAEFVVKREDLRWVNPKCPESKDQYPRPKPPRVISRSSNNILLSWKDGCLPLPVGIVDSVEVQYAAIPRRQVSLSDQQSLSIDNATTADGEEDEGNITKGKQNGKSSGDDNLHWSVLVLKYYSNQIFFEHNFAKISPGRFYRFRMRYHTYQGWTEYSKVSKLHSTLSTKPSTPAAPVSTAITCYAVELHWSAPKDNGSPIFDYLLQGKSIGDVYVDLYRGDKLSFLALGLYPEFSYSFRVAAINAIGISDFSDAVSVVTPANYLGKRFANTSSQDCRNEYGYTNEQIETAMKCRDAWSEFWDPKTEQVFYFNSILSVRQLEIPPILLEPEEDEADDEGEDGDEDGEGIAPSSSSRSGTSGNNRRNGPTGSASASSKSNNNSPIRGGTGSQRPGGGRGSPGRGPTPPAGGRGGRGGTSQPQSTKGKKLKSSQQLLEIDKVFRTKRYRLVRALHKRKTNILSNYLITLSQQQLSSNETNNKVSEILTITLRRNYLIEDFYLTMKDLPTQEVLRRFKICFHGEEGIDSGGLSKEAFLLLAKELAQFSSMSELQWMTYTKVNGTVTSTEKEDEKNKKKDYDNEDEKKGTSTGSPKTHESLIETELEGLFFHEKGCSSKPCMLISSLEQRKTIQKQQKARAKAMADAQKGGPIPTIEPDDESAKPKVMISREHFGRILGILLGKAIIDRQLIDFPLSSILIKHMLGRYEQWTKTPIASMIPIGAMTSNGQPMKLKSGNIDNLAINMNDLLKEIEYIDKEFCQSMNWILNNDITNIIDETFSITPITTTTITTTSTPSEVIPLCPNGDQIEVNETNKRDYVYLMCLWKLNYGISYLLKPFLEAFQYIVPIEILRDAGITVPELNLILNGKQSVNIEELRAYCMYQGKSTFNDSHDSVVYLWRAIREFNENDRRLFLKFFTGSSRVPLDGYDPPITITEGEDMVYNSLPKAHTCFNQLVLPNYSDYETSKDRLLFAIRNTEGFGFA